MPPKSKAKSASHAVSSPSPKKKTTTTTAVGNGSGQTSLNAFFASPSSKAKGKAKGEQGGQKDEKAPKPQHGNGKGKVKAIEKGHQDEGVIDLDNSEEENENQTNEDVMSIGSSPSPTPITKEQKLSFRRGLVTDQNLGVADGPTSAKKEDASMGKTKAGEGLVSNGLLNDSVLAKPDEDPQSITGGGGEVPHVSGLPNRAVKAEQKEDEEDEEDIIMLSDSTPDIKPRIPNPNSSSSHSNIKPSTIPLKLQAKPKEIKPLAPMFQRKRKASLPPPDSHPVDRKPPFSPIRRHPSTIVKGEDSTDIKPNLDSKPSPTKLLSLQNPLQNPSSSSSLKSTTQQPLPILDFDQDPLTFRPERIVTGDWPGGRLPYEVLVGVYVAVGGTRSRLAIVRMLTNFLRLLIYKSPEDLLSTIYLLSNHLSPSYIPLELGIGNQILNKSIKEVSGITTSNLKTLWDKYGDAGDVAFEAKSSLRTLVRPNPLLTYMVFEQLVKMATMKGNGVGRLKGDIVRRLLVQAKGEEVRYLVRTFVAHLRIGAVRLTLLASLARAFVLTRSSGCNTSQGNSSPLHASTAELDQVKPIPIKQKGKGKGKAKEEPGEMREVLEGKMIEGNAMLRKVYVRHPNYDDILIALLEGGLENLDERVPLSVGIPLSPMLGSITRSLSEVFTRLGSLPFTAEAKLDGQRVQIHARTKGPGGKDDGGGRWVESKFGGKKVWVRLFSRHLEDMTEKYPDVNGLVSRMINRPLPASRTPFSDLPELSRPDQTMLNLLQSDAIESFVIDAEIVALDVDSGAYRTFQELSNRAKKDVKVEDIKVIVGVFAFDLMLLNDTPLLKQSFSIRRHLLRTLFESFHDKSDPTIARFGHVESIDSTKPEDVQAFFDQVISQKCEGLMVKLLESGEGLAGEDEEPDETVEEGKKGKNGTTTGTGGKKKPLPSTYEPDMRSQGWLKVKKDYLEGMGDSLDLVPIGAWWGLGRKAGWWSPILLALYNPDTGALEAVCKCISGFSDQFYKDLSVRYPSEGKPEMCRKGEPFTYVETRLRPDYWFNPSEVWELRGADISLSPVYTASASHLGNDRGLSMRFPRFIKIRDDKTWEDATTSAQFAEMYRNQCAVGTTPAVGKIEEMDEAEGEGEGEGEGDDEEDGA